MSGPAGRSTPSPRKRRRERFIATDEDSLNEEIKGVFFEKLTPFDTRGVFIPLWVHRITRNPTEALALSQVVYWLDSDRAHSPRPARGLSRRWTALTSNELAEQLGRTDDEIDKALARLKLAGFIDWKCRKFGRTLHRHIWLNWHAMGLAYVERLKELNEERLKELNDEEE